MCNSPLVTQAYIKQSVILNYQVCRDKTSSGCYIPTHCPRLPDNVTATLSPLIGRMDSLRYATSTVGVCGRQRGGQMCVRAGASPSSPCSSLSHHAAPPLRAAATYGACQEPEHGRTDGRATQYAAALTDRRRSTAHEDVQDTLLQYYE